MAPIILPGGGFCQFVKKRLTLLEKKWYNMVKNEREDERHVCSGRNGGLWRRGRLPGGGRWDAVFAGNGQDPAVLYPCAAVPIRPGDDPGGHPGADAPPADGAGRCRSSSRSWTSYRRSRPKATTPGPSRTCITRWWPPMTANGWRASSRGCAAGAAGPFTDGRKVSQMDERYLEAGGGRPVRRAGGGAGPSPGGRPGLYPPDLAQVAAVLNYPKRASSLLG